MRKIKTFLNINAWRHVTGEAKQIIKPENEHNRAHLVPRNQYIRWGFMLESSPLKTRKESVANSVENAPKEE